MAAYISFQPKDFFNSLTYQGNGAIRSITGVGFQPDFEWIKSYTPANQHNLFDSIRGATKDLRSNDTTAEITAADSLTSFDSDGFSLGADTAGVGVNYASNEEFLAWSWKAGTTSGLSGGTITPSSYSINTTSKFGIYKYTGTGATATIAHGLGTAPSAIIVKRVDDAESWMVGQSFTSEGDGNDWDKGWNLNTNSASGDDVNYWNDTAPTSTLITLGSHGTVNGNTNTYIMYVWCDVPGMQKFGLYMGNGNANGTQVNLGFEPSLLMTKRLSTSDWNMFTTVHPGYNLTSQRVFANTSSIQSTSTTNSVDFLSNGFKLRGSGDETNSTQNNYIYFAWSKFPMVSSNDVAGTSR